MKTVMITGCNGGIGKASVRRFLSEGWHVVGMVLPILRRKTPVIRHLRT